MNTNEKSETLPVIHEISEPSILSADPNERKLARKLRMQRTMGVLHKQKEVVDEHPREITPIETQIIESSDVLEKLLIEGEEVISCVKIANDAREVERRKRERDMREHLLKKLEHEDKECMKKYASIVEKWPKILESKDPLHIHAEMASQNNKCSEVLARKEAIIEELKEKLVESDLLFENDQKKQNEDINLLIDRMEKHINVMSEAYQRELSLIDNVIESERKTFLKKYAERWESSYQQLRVNEIEGREQREQIMRDYEIEMKRVIQEHHEAFRETKIRLELEKQHLEQEVERIKANCFINIEKMNYNYLLLKDREGQNTIMKNQQQKKINKLQDVLNNLKKDYAEMDANTKTEIQKLTDQILKLHKNILELEEKSNQFTDVNEKKYFQVWDMNVEIAENLLSEILAIDKTLHEQVLCLEWCPPEISLLKKEDLPSYRSTVNAIQQEQEKEEERKKIFKLTTKSTVNLERINLERRLLSQILQHVADSSGYLIEDSLSKLLEPYKTNDQLVVRLDNVFQALDLNVEDEINILLYFFLPYSYCPECTPVNELDIACEKPKEQGLAFFLKSSDSCHCEEERIKESSTKNENVVTKKIQDADEKMGIRKEFIASSSSSEISNPSSDEKSLQKPLLCDKGHSLEIQTSYVTKALREFMETYHSAKNDKISQSFTDKLFTTKLTVSRNLSTKDVVEFWERYRNIFSANKVNLWDALLIGLKKYYVILKDRHSLNSEVEFLRRQNIELQQLLKTHVNEPEDDILERVGVCTVSGKT